MPLKDDLKALIIKCGWSITTVSSELNNRHGTDMSVQNLSSKMKRGTLKYSEVEEILDIIGYKIEWTPK